MGGCKICHEVESCAEDDNVYPGRSNARERDRTEQSCVSLSALDFDDASYQIKLKK